MTRYRIEQCNQYGRTLWLVKRGNRVLSHHEYKADAECAAQSYVADDAWEASNR